MYNKKNVAAAAKASASKAKQIPSGSTTLKKRTAKANAKSATVSQEGGVRSPPPRKIQVKDRDSEIRVSDSSSKRSDRLDGLESVGANLPSGDEWEIPPQKREKGDPNCQWPDPKSKMGQKLARLDRHMWYVTQIAEQKDTYDLVDFCPMLKGDAAVKPLNSNRYQCYLGLGEQTRFVWFDFKSKKASHIDAWGRNTSFIGVFKDRAFLHLVTECCLSPVKINRGNKHKDDNGPEWHYCLASGKWVQPYETMFISYEKLLNNWGDETLENQFRDFYFHNLGAVVTKGVMPIVCDRQYWAGRSLNVPRGSIVKPQDNSPLEIREKVQVLPGQGPRERIGGLSSIKHNATTNASTKQQAEELVRSMEQPTATQPVEVAPIEAPIEPQIAVSLQEEVERGVELLRTGQSSQPQIEMLNTTVVDPEVANQAASIEKENHRLLSLQQARAEQPLTLAVRNPRFGGDEDRSMGTGPVPAVSSTPGSPKSYGVVSSNWRMRSQSPVSGHSIVPPKAYPQPSALQKKLCQAQDEVKSLKARVSQLESQLSEAYANQTEALQALAQSEREKGQQAVDLANTKSLLEGYRNSLRVIAGLYKQRVIREGVETNTLNECKNLLLPGFSSVGKQHMLSITSEDWRMAQQQSIAPAFLQSPTQQLQFTNESFENMNQGNQGQQ